MILQGTKGPQQRSGSDGCIAVLEAALVTVIAAPKAVNGKVWTLAADATGTPLILELPCSSDPVRFDAPCSPGVREDAKGA